MIALYPRLAVTGIRKNSKLYFPYIGTCIGMVTMYYIIHSLSFSPTLREMKGGGTMEAILGLGVFVIAIFSVIFLLYTNSFLIRRRNKEFGLYHVLGMGKPAIARILVWETLFTAVLSIVLGLTMGIALSKLAELLLLKIVHGQVDYRITLSVECVTDTALMFGCIFLLLLLKSLWTVYRSDPLALLKSETVGEKPPKGNWLLALAGIVMLGIAYYFAATIKNPSMAVGVFFLLVILVIIATYLLFISGSVTLCRSLQKNKKYYYRKNHFVSVSTMAYRMKRNGAGLASICILSTMVLVMISSSSSLYIGAEDSLRARYPRDNEIDLKLDTAAEFDEDHIGLVRQAYEAALHDSGAVPENLLDFRYAMVLGLQDEDSFQPISSAFNATDTSATGGDPYAHIRVIYFLSARDYNTLMGTNLSPASGEAYLAVQNCTYNFEALSTGILSFRILDRHIQSPPLGESYMGIIPSLLLVVSDWDQVLPMADMEFEDGEPVLDLRWCYGYDLDCSDAEKMQVFQAQEVALHTVDFLMENGYGCRVACMAEARRDFYMLYGSLFFIGIVLSIVFLFAAALIVYYKQISEGYEDQARFSIMQKVGMTKQDIRRSINSQVLTVFFAPLLFAGVHMAFAFPMVWLMLQMFGMKNLILMILTTLAAFAVFGVFYIIIYWFTAGAYYSIVSGARQER
ncbi:MAG: FtsX-like permease family protein [Faecousia sp.]